jgi:squalene cyclase
MMQSHHKQWQWQWCHRWNLMLDALFNAYMNAYVKKKQKHRSTVASKILFFLFYLYRSWLWILVCELFA